MDFFVTIIAINGLFCHDNSYDSVTKELEGNE